MHATSAASAAPTVVALVLIGFVGDSRLRQVAEFDLDGQPSGGHELAIGDRRPEARATNVAQHGFVLESHRSGLDEHDVAAIATRIDVESDGDVAANASGSVLKPRGLIGS